MIGKLGEIEREGIGAKDPKAAFHTYLERVDVIWPDMDRDANMVVSELRKDKSKFYPRWMVDEFSVYFEKNARGLSCHKPNFNAIRTDIDRRFDAAAIVAAKEAQAARQREIDEGLKKNIQYVFEAGTLEYEIKVAVSNATYKMIDQVEDDLRKSIEKCNEQFDPIADKFFANKGVSQPGFPDSVLLR